LDKVKLLVLILILAAAVSSIGWASSHTELASIRGEVLALQEDYAQLSADYVQALSRISQLEAMLGVKVEVLMDAEYYEKALDLVERCNSSIYVVMYVLKYDPGDPEDPANDLVRALIEAAERGVVVKVVLENGVDTNIEAYSYLQEQGVEVHWDPEGVTTHAKLMVVDSYIVLVGSHNWTESALWYNHEVSALIESEELASQLIEYIESL